MTLTLTLTLTAQEPIPRFKSGVDIVQFTVTVLDRERRPVTGLTANDFDVLVDGTPRPLAAFAAVTLPDDTSTVATSVPRVASDVQTNQLSAEGRLVVIVIDRSTPNGPPMQAARAVARAAIDHLGPSDLAAVVFTSAFSRKYSQGFTSDRALLRQSVDQAVMGALGEAPFLLTLGNVGARGSVRRSDDESRVQLASEESSGECVCGVCVLEQLTTVVKALSGPMVRHKSILFVGSDIAAASRQPSSTCAARIHTARERLSRALDEANVTFDAVDPRGLEPLGDAPEFGGPVARGDQAANLFRQSSLATFPDYTGGRVVMNTNRPADAIGSIFEESRAYYVLAVARDRRRAGTEDRHKVKITVRRKDATVLARNLYFAADANAKPTPSTSAAAAALAELLPRADFPLQMNLVPQFSRDGSAELRVLLGVDAAVAGRLDVLIGAFDTLMRPAGEPLKQRLDVPAAAIAGAAAFQWTSVLKPPPGDLEIRAAVATADATRAASVIGYVHVPDLRKERLALSGILVATGGTPTLRRDFAAGDTVRLSFQVAHPSDKPADVPVRYLVRDDLGQTIADATVPRDRAVRLASAVDGYEIAVRLPAATGRYVLTIEAGDGRMVAHRSLPLTVR